MLNEQIYQREELIIVDRLIDLKSSQFNYQISNNRFTSIAGHKTFPVNLIGLRFEEAFNPISTGGAHCAPPCWFFRNQFFLAPARALRLFEFSY